MLGCEGRRGSSSYLPFPPLRNTCVVVASAAAAVAVATSPEKRSPLPIQHQPTIEDAPRAKMGN